MRKEDISTLISIIAQYGHTKFYEGLYLALENSAKADECTQASSMLYQHILDLLGKGE